MNRPWLRALLPALLLAALGGASCNSVSEHIVDVRKRIFLVTFEREHHYRGGPSTRAALSGFRFFSTDESFRARRNDPHGNAGRANVPPTRIQLDMRSSVVTVSYDPRCRLAPALRICRVLFVDPALNVSEVQEEMQ